MPGCNFTPQELHKTVLPTYVIEPPDILTIDAIRVMPRSPYHLRSLDTLAIQVQGTLPDAPISGIFLIEPPGFVRLGPRYGAVQVAGLTVEEAEAAIQKQLLSVLREPVTSVGLAQVASGQQIAGLHLSVPTEP